MPTCFDVIVRIEIFAANERPGMNCMVNVSIVTQMCFKRSQFMMDIMLLIMHYQCNKVEWGMRFVRTEVA